MKIVADLNIPFLKGVFEPYADVIYLPSDEINNAAVRDADALIIRSLTRCDRELLQGTGVEFIATATSGDDHIDKLFCKRQGIAWKSAKGANARAVAQYVMAAFLFLVRSRELNVGALTAGVIGAGNIGSIVAEMLRATGAEVLLNDPPRALKEGSSGFTDMETIVSEADLISMHVPLEFRGERPTYRMVDEQLLNRFAKPLILINTSRGEVVDTGGMIRSIRRGRIMGCAIDVWEHEPDVNREFALLADIATAHIAGYSKQGKVRATRMAVESVARYFGITETVIRSVPLPERDRITIPIDCNGLAPVDLAHRAIQKTYNIESDSRVFKEDPGSFTRIRNNYPYRDENGSYRVQLKGCPPEGAGLMEALDYQVELI